VRPREAKSEPAAGKGAAGWRRRRALWAAGVALALWRGPAGARAEEDYAEGMLDRAAALAAARTATAEAFPDAESVLVDALRRVRYEADGRYTEWYEEYVRILTEEGRRGYETLSSHFTIPYQRGPEDCRITLVELVKPDGRTQRVDVAAASRVMIDPSSMGQNIYNPNDRVLQVGVAGLEPGDVLHYVFFDRIVQPRMRDTWSDWIVLEGERPILRCAVEIDAPRERPLSRILLRDEVPGTVTAAREERGERIVYRWEARQVPRLFPEPDMPPPHTVAQRLLVSTIPDWPTVSRWYWGLSEPHYETTPEMRAKVAELTAGLEDRRRRIEALFRFVAQEVRYLGITVEAEAPGYEPHDVKDTFEARHGVCRDKAALLAALLRLAGFEAFPALIQVGPRRDPEVPLPYFNHAIAAVREPGGEYLLMDPTDETARRLLPSYLGHRSYLVATPEGEELRTSPVEPAAEHLLRIETTGRLTPAGRLIAETRLHFEGINDNAYRGGFARWKPEERRQFFEAAAMSVLPGARLHALELEPADLMDVSQPLRARLSYEAEDALVAGGRTAAVTLPLFGTQLGMANLVIGQTGLKQRKYPLLTEMACGVSERVALALPAELATPAELPEGQPVDSSNLLWTIAWGLTNGQLTAAADFQVRTVEFAPDEYRHLKETLARVEQDLRKLPLLAPAAPRGGDGGRAETAAADARVLEERASFEVRDAGSWTEERRVRKEILTYAGKKQNGEIKIPFNPAWEDVELAEATVTGADGARRSIRPQEINIMDAPWVGAAPRYPAGKVLVASLPGVEVGSVIEYRFVRARREQPFFALRESFASHDPILLKRVRLDAPAGLPLRVELRHNEDGAVTETALPGKRGRRILEWTARDAPAVPREEQQPPWWAFNPTVFVSSGAWPRYAAELEAALRRAAARQGAAEAKARELAAAARDPGAAIQSIRDFVARNVREAGPALHELPRACVTPADRTLREGYGNTTDRAVLLYAMLRAAGYAPQFVLASSAPGVPALRNALETFPAASAFPEALVRVRDPQAAEVAYLYLGDTDQYAALGATPHTGRIGLPLPEGRLEVIEPPRDDQSVVDYALAIDERGEARLTRKELLFGNAFGREHRRFAEMTPEERRRYFQEMLGAVSQAAEAEGELRTDFTGYPGLVEFTARVPRYAVRDGEYLYAALPEMLGGFVNLKSGERRTPLYFGAAARRKVRVRLELPAGFRLEHAPEALPRAAAPALEAAAQVSAADGGALALEAEVAVTPGLVPAARYAEVLKLTQTLAHPRRRTAILRQGIP